MAGELLEDRVKKLEKALDSLAEVPKQLTGLGQRVERIEVRTERIEGRVTNVESQISQLRSDMRVGFSAASCEVCGTRDGILEVIDSSSKATQKLYDEGREEMRRQFGEVKGEIAQTRADMRVLHEDLVSRIALINKQ